MAIDCFFVNIPKTAGTSIRVALDYKKYPHEHLWAAKIIERLGQDEWNRLFTFTFVRNPWDRVVSQYHFRAQKEPHALWKDLYPQEYWDDPLVDFKTWVYEAYGDHGAARHPHGPAFSEWRLQTDWYMDGDECLVDFIGSFERLHRDFSHVCQRIGVPTRNLSHHKQSTHGPWQDYYDSATADIVAEYFARDIEILGYEAPV